MVMGAQVSVGGQVLGTSYDRDTLTAVAGLSFDWGREALYDAVDPGVLRFSVIDRTGQWAADQALNGQPVLVERTDPYRVMFRGSVATAAVRQVTIRDPDTSAVEDVWIADVTASSVLADAAAAVFTGPSAEATNEGLGGWAEQGFNLRIDAVFAQGGNSIFASIGQPAASPPGVSRRLRSVPADRRASLLELIEGAYAIAPLAAVDYDPQTNAVRPATFVAAANVVLTYLAGRVSITLPSGRVLSASRVLTPNGYTATTTVADSVDVVTLPHTWYGKDPALTAGSQKRTTYLSRVIQAMTTRGAGRRTRRVLEVAKEMMTLDPTEFSGSVEPTNAGPPFVLSEAVKIVNTLNGQLRLPTLRLDDRRLPIDDAGLRESLFSPVATTFPLYFGGSVFNSLPNAGPQYQVVGGTFTYDRGWTHELHLAPARNSPRDELTVASLFGASDASWGQFDPDLSLSDLSTVTQGL